MPAGSTLRRAGLPVALIALGLLFGLLVGRWPADRGRTVVTRRAHGADPLLSASILRFQVASLVSSPSRFYQPPFLFPDPNPLRGTEPLLSEALLAVPFRLLLGDRPALVFTLLKLATLALVTVFTGLLLRELGVRPALCLAAGVLVVTTGTTAVFVDRLQALSIQWLPLAGIFAARVLRRGRTLDAALFGASAFLAVQASLYTAVMLLVPAPFVVAALWGQRRSLFTRRAALLFAAGGSAALVSAAVLWPYARQRADVAAYASEAMVAVKSWSPVYLEHFGIALPEYAGWPLGPAADWDGLFPGTAFLLFVGGVAAFTLRPRLDPEGAPATFRWAKPGLVALLSLAGLAAAFGVAVPTPFSRVVAQWSLLGALAAWGLRLATWPTVKNDADARGLVASAAAASALLLALVACGSPIALREGAAPLLDGVFAPLSRALPPLRELRELKRCLLPAGFFAIVAGALAIERRVHGTVSRAATALASLVIVVAATERLSADTRKASVSELPPAYALLRQSQGTGGLLELPFDDWGRIDSVHRMLWQPAHGRPVVAGRTGIEPAWYHPAQQVFGEFPSEECLRLLRSWRIDTVLDTREVETPQVDGIAQRAELKAPAGRRSDATWRVIDVVAGAALPAEPEPGPGEWRTPTAAVPASALAVDGSAETAAELDAGAVGVEVELPPGASVGALELLYRGRFVRVPRELRISAQSSDGEWREVATDGAVFLRARAADLQLRKQGARLVVPIAVSGARRLRLASAGEPWDLPELRIRVVETR
jgi:hypothetical protein